MISNFKPIYISAYQCLSALGSDHSEVWSAYRNGDIGINTDDATAKAFLPQKVKANIETLRHSNSKYKGLDLTTLMAIYASRHAVKAANWTNKDHITAVNLSSSRGATHNFESHFKAFQEGKTSPLASPTTTLGNISSWVGQDLGYEGFMMSHSITCSSSLHAILNAYAWIEAGLCQRVVAGGVEAPLTDFTLAQMKALKIYSPNNQTYPCTPLAKDKVINDFVLGEGCGVFCLEKEETLEKEPLAIIKGIGFAAERIKHATAINKEGTALYKAMKAANAKEEYIDAVIIHAPGTIAGEKAELKAISDLFKEAPYVISNKYTVGHTFAAAGALNLELAILLLKNQEIVRPPYPLSIDNKAPKQIKNILVNAIGFGGNAVSVLVGL